MSVVSLPSPLPWADIEPYLPAGFILNSQGLFLDKDTPVWIAGPCWVSALARSTRGDGWGRVIRWIDQDGHLRHHAFPAELLTARGQPIANELQARGLLVIPGEQSRLMRYLGSFKLPLDCRLTAVNKLGWLDGKDTDPVYMLPEGPISVKPDDHIIFQPELHCPSTHTLHSRGSLEHWKIHVAMPCQGNPQLVFSLCAAFSGPLLKFVGLDSGGFHLFGTSSKGKTTALQVTASVWGCGADPAVSGDSYIGRWNTTGNALEAVAAAHNDGLLALDEMGTCDAKNFGKVIYDLLGGKGKSRLDKNSRLQAQREWRITALSTGEISVQQKILEDTGKAPMTGQLIRMIDIPIHNGVLVDGHGGPLADLANRLKTACSQYYGTAAPAFIQRLITLEPDGSALQRRLKDEVGTWARDLADSQRLESFQQRVLQRFSVVLQAGVLAVDFGILPFKRAEIVLAVQAVWRDWLGDTDNQPDAVRGVRAVKNFLHSLPGRAIQGCPRRS